MPCCFARLDHSRVWTNKERRQGGDKLREEKGWGQSKRENMVGTNKERIKYRDIERNQDVEN